MYSDNVFLITVSSGATLLIIATMYVIYKIIHTLFFKNTIVVKEVRDGDSADQARLFGIDAPELDQDDDGIKARDYLKKQIEGKRVRFKDERTKSGKVKMAIGRPLRTYYSYWFRIDINRRMVKTGNAIPSHSDRYEKDRVKVKYVDPAIHRKNKKNK